MPASPSARGRAWTPEEAERHLLSLELFGMRFGLDRMRRLLTALGSPQQAFRAVHVVGTNGKSSTTRMTAAILRAHGLRTGAYLSPHLRSFAERVRVEDADVPEQDFAIAVQRAAAAAVKVDRTLQEGDRVTQFELLTAASLWLLAQAGVEVAVVEAGLGGRFDATNVLDRSEVQVLTNVGLEHTRWLGPTVADIAREKLDVVRPGATLAVGAAPHPEALALAERLTAERGAQLVIAPADPGLALHAAGGFQRRNFALARTAAAALLGEDDEHAVREAADLVTVPGRFELVDVEPDTIVDGAHNPGGMAVLAETLREVLGGRRLVAAVSILDDKDAAGMLRELLPLCAEIVCTANRNPRALPPATLESLCRQLGGPPARSVNDPRAALASAREAAGPEGVALATGSIYLVAELVT